MLHTLIHRYSLLVFRGILHQAKPLDWKHMEVFWLYVCKMCVMHISSQIVKLEHRGDCLTAQKMRPLKKRKGDLYKTFTTLLHLLSHLIKFFRLGHGGSLGFPGIPFTTFLSWTDGTFIFILFWTVFIFSSMHAKTLSSVSSHNSWSHNNY